jgi:hypothetical protein
MISSPRDRVLELISLNKKGEKFRSGRTGWKEQTENKKKKG